MIWDPCLTRAVADELTAALKGARARAVTFRGDAMEVVVHFRDATVMVDLSPGRGVIVLGPPSEPDEDAAPLPAVLAGMETVRDERVMLLHFRRVRGKKAHPTLILELATNRWNAILADGPALRVRKGLTPVKSRPLQVGQPWTSPGDRTPARARHEMDRRGWVALLKGLGEAEARSALLARVAFTSGLNVGYLLDAKTLDEGFERWCAVAAMTAVAPHILRQATGPQPYPWPLSGCDAEPVGSLLEGMATVRANTDRKGSPGGGRVTRFLAAESRRLKRMLKRLRTELARTGDAARLRDDGSLILSCLHLIEPGTKDATLPGFDGEPRTLKLDPRLRPQEHANALFRRAARMERGAAALPGRIHAAEAELARIDDLRRRNALGELPPEEVEPLLRSRPASTRPTPESPALPYRSFTSSGGLEIRVGRGARHNDALTFHHSRPADIWLHARHAAGAHVILRWTRPERPPATDLEEAAVLAANHSGARASGTVPVDWTRRKWVRKPRRASPGAVLPERVQTVFVSPDPSLGERLGGG
ncbi:MAG: NFACT RNA binding domain-containing protein [Gemmatimonadetes bacterium]|nr:NFACT RNA binding domain-containing protein [Gemmatimonadota bacterium]